jgi:hypothetical protein
MPRVARPMCSRVGELFAQVHEGEKSDERFRCSLTARKASRGHPDADRDRFVVGARAGRRYENSTAINSRPTTRAAWRVRSAHRGCFATGGRSLSIIDLRSVEKQTFNDWRENDSEIRRPRLLSSIDSDLIAAR